MDKATRRRVDPTWMAFLVMAFAVVGLTGLFATFAAPLPLHRALIRDQALDDVLAAAAGPDAQTAIEALRPQLAESADALLPVQADIVDRVARERAAMHARFIADADETDLRLRWLICMATVVSAVFGVVILGVAARQRR